MEIKGAHTLLAKLGSKIKHLRTNKKISQAALADICGLQKANLSRIESGKTNITMVTLISIAQGLNVTVVELFTEAS